MLYAFTMAGSMAILTMGTGILAAHMYDFLTRLYPTFGGGTKYIRTPAMVRRWFGGDKRGTTRAYGAVYRPAMQQPAPLSGWSGRGQGQRLGGG